MKKVFASIGFGLVVSSVALGSVAANVVLVAVDISGIRFVIIQSISLLDG